MLRDISLRCTCYFLYYFYAFNSIEIKKFEWQPLFGVLTQILYTINAVMHDMILINWEVKTLIFIYVCIIFKINSSRRFILFKLCTTHFGLLIMEILMEHALLLNSYFKYEIMYSKISKIWYLENLLSLHHVVNINYTLLV